MAELDDAADTRDDAGTPLADAVLAWHAMVQGGHTRIAIAHAQVALDLLDAGEAWEGIPVKRATFLHWCGRMKLLRKGTR